VHFGRGRRFGVEAMPMTFRIDRLVSEESVIVLHLSGRLDVECVNTIKELIEKQSNKKKKLFRSKVWDNSGWTVVTPNFRLRLSFILHTYVYSAFKVKLDGPTTDVFHELLKLCI
jgi:hypothetical protein